MKLQAALCFLGSKVMKYYHKDQYVNHVVPYTQSPRPRSMVLISASSSKKLLLDAACGEHCDPGPQGDQHSSFSNPSLVRCLFTLCWLPILPSCSCLLLLLPLVATPFGALAVLLCYLGLLPLGEVSLHPVGTLQFLCRTEAGKQGPELTCHHVSEIP